MKRMLALTVTLAAIVSSAFAHAPPTERTPVRAASEAARKEFRLREGTKVLDRVGRFQISGDRTTFTSSQGSSEESFRVLENLMLERVTQLVNESPTERQWLISGTITEFRGANYLLLQRAVIIESELPKAP